MKSVMVCHRPLANHGIGYTRSLRTLWGDQDGDWDVPPLDLFQLVVVGLIFSHEGCRACAGVEGGMHCQLWGKGGNEL
jgi:hypothetical protein